MKINPGDPNRDFWKRKDLEEYEHMQIYQSKPRCNPFGDWRVWLGGVGIFVFLYGLLWAFAAICVMAGHAKDVCGI